MTPRVDVLIFPVCLTMALCADGLADKPAVLLAGAGILLLAFGAVRAASGHKKSRPSATNTETAAADKVTTISASNFTWF